MRLNRLVLEYNGTESSMMYYMTYSKVKSGIMHLFVRRLHDEGYPLDINKVISMCKLEFIGNRVFIGYRPESYRTNEEQEIYKKLLDLEYGYNGHEIRIVRKVLEGVR